VSSDMGGNVEEDTAGCRGVSKGSARRLAKGLVRI
jgi:hypothetical protein